MTKVLKSQKGFFGQLKASLSGMGNAKEVALDDEIWLQNEKIKISLKHTPLGLELGEGGCKLHLAPDVYIDDNPRNTSFSLRIFDPAKYSSEITGFLRINPGEKLYLGRHNDYQKNLFNYPKDMADRHLSISYEDKYLVLKDHGSKGGTRITPIKNTKKWTKKVASRRTNLLNEIHTIYGGAIERLDSDVALETLRAVNNLLEIEPCRPRDTQDKPGGVVTLPAKMVPIIVGDLHAQVDNLLTLLSRNNFLEMMSDGKAALVFLGDAVHKEVDGQMEEMDSSLLIMDVIFRLKLWFPQQVFYVRGNHDCFSEDIGKDGVPQGLLWKAALEKHRGKVYRQEMDRFYDLLPYVALSGDFVACHAAPPKSKVSMDLLVNIHQYPGLIVELTCNRPQTPNRPAGYTRGDVKRFRKALKLPETADLFVGHTPLDRDDTLWMDVGGIDHHHVVFSGNKPWIGVVTRIGDNLVPLRYPTENLLSVINALPPLADEFVERELQG